MLKILVYVFIVALVEKLKEGWGTFRNDGPPYSKTLDPPRSHVQSLLILIRHEQPLR